MDAVSSFLDKYDKNKVVEESSEILGDDLYTTKEERDISKVFELLRYFVANRFKYGISHGSRIIRSDDDFNRLFDRIYKLLSPSEFDKLRVGVCWDYVIYQEYWLKKKGLKPRSYFICTELKSGETPTHTFTIVPIGRWFVYIEYSWGKFRGVYKSSSLEEMISFIRNSFIGEYESYNQGYHYPVIITDITGYKKYGATYDVFMNDSLTSEKVFNKRIRYNKSIDLLILQIMDHRGNIVNGPEIDLKASIINEECENNHLILKGFDSYFVEDFDDFEITDEIAVFEAAIKDSPRLKDLVYPRIEATLKDKNNDRKAKKIVNDYVERNMDKLSTPGPLYQLVFGETDKQPYWDLFKITPEEVVKTMTIITKETGSNSQFMLLRQNPIFVILYFLIRYYTIKNDKIGINVFVSMFSLAMYPSIFKKYYPKGCIESVMKYTIDSLTNKFLIKKAGTLFAILNDSGNRAYTFQKSRIINGSDVDVVSYIQRVHNDQNSMFKKITSEYKKNYDAGNYASTKNTEYDSDTPIHDGDENATSVVQYLVDKVALPIISGGVDVVYAEAAATIAKISVSTTRECLMKILLPKNLPKLQSFIESILFLYIYEEKTQISTIKSGAFLVWAEALFKKTNSKNKNIGNIKGILEEWAKESGVYEKVVEKKAISYKKAIFMYIILMIQKFS